MNSGERRALRHYRLRGYHLVAANVHAGRSSSTSSCGGDGGSSSHPEVKEKGGDTYGDPLEMVSPEKVRRVLAVAGLARLEARVLSARALVRGGRRAWPSRRTSAARVVRRAGRRPPCCGEGRPWRPRRRCTAARSAGIPALVVGERTCRNGSGEHVHRLHPYLGKFIPQLVEALLVRYVHPGAGCSTRSQAPGRRLVQSLSPDTTPSGWT